jgi:hypothetical protein
MQNHPYIEILTWAYERRSKPFLHTELLEKFNQKNDSDFNKWYAKVFRGGTTNEDCLVGIQNYDQEENFYCLTSKGLSSAIEYLILEETKKNSEEAKKIALWSIWIAISVGIFQILINLIPIFGIKLF